MTAFGELFQAFEELFQAFGELLQAFGEFFELSLRKAKFYAFYKQNDREPSA